MRQLRVLIGCECSGRVRDAFAARGWEAWSADILPSETHVRQEYCSRADLAAKYGSSPIDLAASGRHYQGDVRDLFSFDHPVNRERAERIRRYDGERLPLWDANVNHPPCTDLAYAGAVWFKFKDARRGGNGKMQAGADFFMEMVNSPSPLVAVENPHSIIQEVKDGVATWAGPPTQTVQPWHFGDPYIKRIDLWLKGLPPLWHDRMVVPTGRVATGGGSWRTDTAAGRAAMSAYEDSEGRKNRSTVRSRTFSGLARAMADQWGAFAEEYYREP